jgi:hypothetical protein
MKQQKHLLITNNTINENKLYYVYPILIWLALFPTIIIFLFCFEVFSIQVNLVIIFCFLPISLVLYYTLFILLLLLFGKLTLIIINLIHKPKEGVFERISRDKDYYFFILRRNLKNFVLEIYNHYPLPWAKILALKILNIKVANNTGILDSFIDSDFVEIGKNTILGEGSVIMSSMIIGEYFLLKKVILRENVTIGAFSVIAPGTIVERGAILGIGSYTVINQKLEKNHIYIGRPAKKWKKIEDF